MPQLFGGYPWVVQLGKYLEGFGYPPNILYRFTKSTSIRPLWWIRFALGYPPMTWGGLGIHQTLLIDLSGEESPSTGPQELLYTPPPTMPSPCPITPHAPPCHFLQPPCPLPSATSYGMEIQVHMGGAHEAYNALCIEPYIASCLGNTKGKNYVACGTSTAPWFWAETM